MLSDHRREIEQRAASVRQRKQLPVAFGNFIASLTGWDWFINPLTFRDLRSGVHAPSIGVKEIAGNLKVFEQDPRITIWRPQWRKRPGPKPFGPPVPALALLQIKDFLRELENASGNRIGWVIGEEFGTIGGRYHAHLLVAGVTHLRRDEWWEKAFERFGRTRIEPFDPQRAAAYYTAKYAAKQLGGLHFGGLLAGVDLAAIENRTPQDGGRTDITQSANLPREFFHNTLRRWHR